MNLQSPRPTRTTKRMQAIEQRRLAEMKTYLKENAREIFRYGRKAHKLCGRGYVVIFCASITASNPRRPAMKATAVKGELRYVREEEDRVLRILLDDAELHERVRKYSAKSECVVVAFYGLQYTFTTMSNPRHARRGN